MRTAYAFLAIAAEHGPGGRLHVFGGDIDTLTLPELPFVFGSGLVLVVKLMFSDSERAGTYSLVVEMTDGDGKVLEEVNEVSISGIAAVEKPWTETGVAVVIPLVGMPFPSAGLYYFRARIDDLELVKVPLLIAEGTPQED